LPPYTLARIYRIKFSDCGRGGWEGWDNNCNAQGKVKVIMWTLQWCFAL
jgi:hypothetical protein